MAYRKNQSYDKLLFQTRIVEMEHIDDPCIPAEVCGLPTFDFLLTFLSFLAWMLALCSFVVPNWGIVTFPITNNNNAEALDLDSGIWQICYRAPSSGSEGNAPRQCEIIENIGDRGGNLASLRDTNGL